MNCKLRQLAVESALAKAEAQQYSGLPAFGTLKVSLAEIAYEKNELQQALKILKDSAEQVQKSGYLDIQKSAAIMEAKLLVAEGNFPEALLVLQKSLAVMQQAEMNLAVQEISAYLAYYQAVSGNRQEAALWAEEFSLPISENPGLTKGGILFLLVRVWLHLGNLPDAADLLCQLEGYAQEGQSHRRLAEVQLLQALTAFRQNKREDAFALIEQSLQIGAKRGFLRLYLDENVALQELLHQFKKSRRPGGWLAELVQYLLNSFSRGIPESPSSAAESPHKADPSTNPLPLIEPLSAREIEVLGLMSEGLTNPQIAKSLILSISTVKTHLNNIYGKLGVRNRAEAVLRAKDHQIL